MVKTHREAPKSSAPQTSHEEKRKATRAASKKVGVLRFQDRSGISHRLPFVPLDIMTSGGVGVVFPPPGCRPSTRESFPNLHCLPLSARQKILSKENETDMLNLSHTTPNELMGLKRGT